MRRSCRLTRRACLWLLLLLVLLTSTGRLSSSPGTAQAASQGFATHARLHRLQSFLRRVQHGVMLASTTATAKQEGPVHPQKILGPQLLPWLGQLQQLTCRLRRTTKRAVHHIVCRHSMLQFPSICAQQRKADAIAQSLGQHQGSVWHNHAQCPACTANSCVWLPWPLLDTSSTTLQHCSHMAMVHQVVSHPQPDLLLPYSCPAALHQLLSPSDTCRTQHATTHLISNLNPPVASCPAATPLLHMCLPEANPSEPKPEALQLPNTCPYHLLRIPPQHTRHHMASSHSWAATSVRAVAAQLTQACMTLRLSAANHVMQLFTGLVLWAAQAQAVTWVPVAGLAWYFLYAVHQLQRQHAQHVHHVQQQFSSALHRSEAAREAAWTLVAWQQVLAWQRQVLQLHQDKMAEQRCRELQGRHEHDMQALTHRLEAMEVVQEQLCECQGLCRTLAMQLDEVRAELSLKDELLAEAHHELELLGHEVMAAQAQLRSAEDQARQHRQLMAQLQESLQEAEEQLTTTQRLAGHAAEELEQVQSVAMRQQQELDKLHRESQDQERKVVLLTQQLAHAAGLIEEMRGCNEGELGQVQALRHQVQEYQQQVETLTRELQASCEVTAECEQELQALRQVRSTGLTWLIEAKDKELQVKDQHIKVLQEAASQRSAATECVQCKQAAALASSVPDTPPLVRIPSTRRNVPNT